MSNGTVDLIEYDVTAPVHTLCVLYDEYRTGGADLHEIMHIIGRAGASPPSRTSGSNFLYFGRLD